MPPPTPTRTCGAPIESKWGNRRNMPNWDDSMTSFFSTDHIVSTDDIQAVHDQLAQRFRAELYVTHQTRPLLATQPAPG